MNFEVFLLLSQGVTFEPLRFGLKFLCTDSGPKFDPVFSKVTFIESNQNRSIFSTLKTVKNSPRFSSLSP